MIRHQRRSWLLTGWSKRHRQTALDAAAAQKTEQKGDPATEATELLRVVPVANNPADALAEQTVVPVLARFDPTSSNGRPNS